MPETFTAHRLPDLVLGNGDAIYFNNGITFYKYAADGSYISQEDPRYFDDERYIDQVIIRDNQGSELMVLRKNKKPPAAAWINWIIGHMEQSDYAYRMSEIEYESLYRRFTRKEKTQSMIGLSLKQ